MPPPCSRPVTSVSIHTPARGVTMFSSIFLLPFCVSIHTPARGVTRRMKPALCDCFSFNPHSRKGSDGGAACRNAWLFGVSIHTPARGVTHTRPSGRSPLSVSIHTPARGVTSAILTLLHPALCFNPHSRKGSDYNRNRDGSICIVSIHTPARGVTPPHLRRYKRTIPFQSTLPQGE